MRIPISNEVDVLLFAISKIRSVITTSFDVSANVLPTTETLPAISTFAEIIIEPSSF